MTDHCEAMPAANGIVSDMAVKTQALNTHLYSISVKSCNMSHGVRERPPSLFCSTESYSQSEGNWEPKPRFEETPVKCENGGLWEKQMLSIFKQSNCPKN